MGGRTRHRSAALVIALAVVIAGACGGGDAESGAVELQVGDGPLIYVQLGNSLTFWPPGVAVNDLVEEMLAEEFDVAVETRDHTVGAQRTDNFLWRLQNDEILRTALEEAHAITFVIPNDEWREPMWTAMGIAGHDPAECGGDDNLQCVRDVIADYNVMVDQIFEELMLIVDPTEQIVRVQDFFQFNTEFPSEDLQLLYPYWHEGQVHVQEVAAEYGIPVARVWDDFMGTDGEIPNLIEAGLVDPDGIHLTAVGAQQVADLYNAIGWALNG